MFRDNVPEDLMGVSNQTFFGRLDRLSNRMESNEDPSAWKWANWQNHLG
jgi:hypothetical protein